MLPKNTEKNMCLRVSEAKSLYYDTHKIQLCFIFVLNHHAIMPGNIGKIMYLKHDRVKIKLV